MATHTQDARNMSIETPFGKDVVMLTSIRGSEGLSELFQFEVEMSSEDAQLDADKIVGEAVTIRIGQEDGRTRYINGIVCSFSGSLKGQRQRTYRATVVPWLWYLSRVSNCRIFQDKSVLAIVEQVFSDYGFAEYQLDGLSGQGAAAVQNEPLGYCVQYNESDFDFVSRLLEEFGIGYFFIHENGKHSLKLFDSPDAFADSTEYELPLRDEGQAQFSRVWNWSHQKSVNTNQVETTDYNYLTPSTSLLSNEKGLHHKLGPGKLEQFEYPGRFQEGSIGKNIARLRMEQLESNIEVAQGESNCKSFFPGARFKLQSEDIPESDGKDFAITRLRLEAIERQGEDENGIRFDYRNEFDSIPKEVMFRPRQSSRRPMIVGPQTARVVGPNGKEIYTDEHGRIKVQFHWDRYGEFNEQSSCWIRVSQMHAGNGWGTIHTPRIGEEVIVEFLNGDPDRPIVTGRVYNGSNRPPFELPDAKEVSGYRSNSSPNGEGGFNQITFDDSTDEEAIVIHAQKDQIHVVQNDIHQTIGNDAEQNVEHDRTRRVGNDESVSIEHDAFLHVENDRNILIKGDQNRSIEKHLRCHVGETYTLMVEKELTIQVGKSSLYMNKEGEIRLVGTTIALQATDDFSYQAEKIQGRANSDHEIWGAVVKQNCS